MEHWAQREGVRAADMVWFDSSSWFESRRVHEAPEEYQNSLWRHTAIWKIRVRPVPGADLAWKRVGIIRFRPPCTAEETLIAGYFATLADGSEEWQVREEWESASYASAAVSHTFAFAVWYQDGAGHTYYDDRNGVGYTVTWS